MKTEIMLDTLSTSELIALVQNLRLQLAERDREIERLTQLLPAVHSTPSRQDRDESTDTEPGSLDALLDQLEREYPEG